MSKILVIGCGSLGSFLTLSLSQDLPSVTEITICDFDNVEERNLRNQAYAPSYIGYPKTESLQDIVFSQYEREIQIINKKLEKENDINWCNWDLIIDATDNNKARTLIQANNYCPHDDITHDILHCGLSEKMTFALEWGDHYKVPSDITSGWDVCTEPGVGSYIRMVAALSSQVAQEFLTTNVKREFVGNRFSLREIT